MQKQNSGVHSKVCSQFNANAASLRIALFLQRQTFKRYVSLSPLIPPPTSVLHDDNIHCTGM
jgi:hypothetical protein